MTTKNKLLSIVIAIVRYICVVINQIVSTIKTGKVKNTKKFIITLTFKKNIKKYIFIVGIKFIIANLIDFDTAGNTHLFSKTIINLEYEINIFIIIENKNKAKNIYEISFICLPSINLIINK